MSQCRNGSFPLSNLINLRGYFQSPKWVPSWPLFLHAIFALLLLGPTPAASGASLLCALGSSQSGYIFECFNATQLSPPATIGPISNGYIGTPTSLVGSGDTACFGIKTTSLFGECYKFNLNSQSGNISYNRSPNWVAPICPNRGSLFMEMSATQDGSITCIFADMSPDNFSADSQICTGCVDTSSFRSISISGNSVSSINGAVDWGFQTASPPGIGPLALTASFYGDSPLGSGFDSWNIYHIFRNGSIPKLAYQNGTNTCEEISPIEVVTSHDDRYVAFLRAYGFPRIGYQIDIMDLNTVLTTKNQTFLTIPVNETVRSSFRFPNHNVFGLVVTYMTSYAVRMVSFQNGTSLIFAPLLPIPSTAPYYSPAHVGFAADSNGSLICMTHTYSPDYVFGCIALTANFSTPRLVPGTPVASNVSGGKFAMAGNPTSQVICYTYLSGSSTLRNLCFAFVPSNQTSYYLLDTTLGGNFVSTVAVKFSKSGDRVRNYLLIE